MTHLIRAQVGEVLLGERKQKISLFHRILLTFHDACDMRDIDVAMRLLKILEPMAIAAGEGASRDRTHVLRGFVAANRRLWNLRFNDSISIHR